MKKSQIEMPDGWEPGNCEICNRWDKCRGATSKNICPLSQAVEVKPTADEGLVEMLAEQEHIQWVAWSQSIASIEPLSEARLARWKKCWIPYAELDEDRKEQDRIWAREIVKILSLQVPAPKEVILNSLCKEAYETSKSKGWKHDNDGQAIALMHSELSEALEAMRKPDIKDEHLPHLDPVGLELADVLIRVFDFCGARGIDLATCVKEKMAYNKSRPMKHGGKAF